MGYNKKSEFFALGVRAMKEIIIQMGWMLPTGVFLYLGYCLYRQMKIPAK